MLETTPSSPRPIAIDASTIPTKTSMLSLTSGITSPTTRPVSTGTSAVSEETAIVASATTAASPRLPRPIGGSRSRRRSVRSGRPR